MITGFCSGGRMYTATAGADGAAWTLPAEHQPAVAPIAATPSYGTRPTTLADGTPVAAFPLNSAIYSQVGAGAVQTFDVSGLLRLRHVAGLGRHQRLGGVVRQRHRRRRPGHFVRQIHPALGPVIQAPGSVSSFGGSPGSLGTGQAVAMVNRPGNGVYLAYLRATQRPRAVALWSRHQPSTLVPGSKGAARWRCRSARRAAVAGLGRRGPTTSARSAPTEGPDVRRRPAAEHPGDANVYHVNIEGSAGRGDVVFNDGTQICTSRSSPG